MRKKAQDLGALTVAAGVEVTGLDVEDGRIKRVRTDQGDIEAETVVIACGVWSPRIAKMAGASIPLTPAVHQMIDIGPVPFFEGTTVARSPTRSSATSTRTCTSASTARASRSARTPTGRSSWSPTTSRRSRSRRSRRRCCRSPRRTSTPSSRTRSSCSRTFVGDEKAGIKLAINGLLSLTPDGNPIIGETPEVKGLWSRRRDLDQGGARRSPRPSPSG